MILRSAIPAPKASKGTVRLLSYTPKLETTDKEYLFIGQVIRNRRQVVLGIGYFDIFCLRAVNYITEFPPPQESAALGGTAILAVKTLATRSDGSDSYPLAGLESLYSGTKGIDYSHKFMADNQSRLDRIASMQNMNVSSTDGCQRYLHYRFTKTGLRFWHIFHPDVIGTAKDQGFHCHIWDNVLFSQHCADIG